ncbi:aryl-alcohol dehydrogenase [Povalibacter uvarum]|uniref:Aryl-alcohol dehydrogenase n=1 Tax=Povalibacter uvarum TaxID=732238 RepID=A0A841HQB8_9GAMM|nr:NAD(P)-dependent alcohol dehydrogenase [Povalibacter uvarum]MBB6095407.1 aryl-alcohol dehydrogenase [Povalibacter uvarum]
MRATAAVLRAPGGRFSIEPVILDALRENEVLVRIVASGICHTDLSAREQLLPLRLPAVLGHEGSGVVEAVGAKVTSVRPGDHVVTSFDFCGDCDSCRDCHVAYCQHAPRLNFSGVRRDGTGVVHDEQRSVLSARFLGQSSFASHANVSESSVVRIDRDVPLELMGPLGCGMQTGAGTVLNVLKPRPGSSIAILGAGSVGFAALMAARIAGCETIIAVDINDARLTLARELGATDTFNALSGDPVEFVRIATKGRGVHSSVECTGLPAVLRQAVDVLAPRGTCALVGVAHPRADAAINMASMLRGRTLVGVTEGDVVPRTFIPQMIEWWREGRFPFDRLVRYFEFARIDEAVAACASGEVVKPVVRMGGG